MIRPRDTSPEVWAMMQAHYRSMSPRERVERSAALTVLAHSFALAEIRRRHPEEDERRHRMRLAARYIPEAVFRDAFGWWPGDEDPR